MSWNQSVCFLKNKLAWFGCGLVWQVRYGAASYVMFRWVRARYVRIWQVRRVKVPYGLFLQGAVWSVRYGVAGQVRCGMVRPC